MQDLRFGDWLPTVATVQKVVGAGIDGQFGSETHGKVQSWQGRKGLMADGVVGRDSWTRMMRDLDLVTLDVVDGTDESLLENEAADIRRAGGDPIILHGMSNGVAVMVNQIFARLNRSRSLALLRIHSHGMPGLMNVSAGTMPGTRHHAGVGVGNLTDIAPQLRRLATCFVRHGALQFMGCDVGRGPAGKALLTQVAALVGVPASAGVGTQYGSGRATFRFEGAVQHGFPFGDTLPAWARMATA